MRNWFRRRALNWCMKSLFGAVTEQTSYQIRKTNNGYQVWRKGKMLDPKQVLILTQEAKLIKKTELEGILREDFTRHCQDILFNKSTRDSDLVAPKAALWAMSLRRNLIDGLSELT